MCKMNIAERYQAFSLLVVRKRSPFHYATSITYSSSKTAVCAKHLTSKYTVRMPNELIYSPVTDGESQIPSMTEYGQVIFGKHIMVEPYMSDVRFDRCILLAKISPDALDWPSFPRE